LKRHKHIALIFFLSLQHFFTAEAQSLPSKYLKFDLLTISDGLSQGMITSILQDHYGFMWFGTKDGLNRYDGYHFVVYRHNPSDTNSLSDNFIQALHEDSKGRIWIGTSNYGVDMFDRKTETFRHFRYDDKNKYSLSDNRVVTIEEDHNGDIWVATLNGVDKISEQENATFRITRYFSELCNVFAAHDGTLWGSSRHSLSFRIHPGKNGSESIDTLDMKKYCTYPEEDDGNEKFISEAIEDTAEHSLYLICEYSISKVNTISAESEIISAQRNHWGVFGGNICMDDKHTIWLSERDWLEQFDVRRKQWTRIFSEDPNLKIVLDNTNVVYRDRSGIIWVGTKGYGLLKYNPRSEKFHQTDHESISWMGATNDGQVVVLKSGEFIDIFNPQTGSYSVSVSDSSWINRVSSYKDFGLSTSAAQDRNGTIWLSKNCLVEYDAATNTFHQYRVADRLNFPVFVDHDNKIWVGTDKVLSRFDPVTKTFTDYHYPVEPVRAPYDFLQCMVEDKAEGIFWLGTMKGLLQFNSSSQSWQLFKNIPDDSSSLSFDLIFSLFDDPYEPQKYLWIGTNGGGLNRFDKQSGKVIRYSMKNGLPNDVIYGILSDDDGNLWLSTNNGLCRFTPKTGATKNFEMKDGLQGNEFNRYAYCSVRNPSDKTKDGTLFFGGVNGFNYFNPKDLSDNPSVPNVEITDFKLRNQSVSFKIKNPALSKPAYLTDKIVLPYSDNMISFEFASMDFTSPEKNLYQYKLEGFNQDWIQSGNVHSATYTNLDPGTYTFTVKGSNNDGVWNEEGKTIQLVILPPWYMTWWFRLLIGIMGISALYGIYRYRLQQALQLQAVRNRIASDLHDEIGSNLSNISIFSEVAQEKLDDPKEVAALLRKVSDYTHTSMEAMSDIVWMINARNDRFENIIVRMRALAAEIFEAKNYALHLNFDERLNALKLGMEKRKNFYLIYKEAINNIAKYADCKNVWIEMKMNRSSVHLTIKDDGKGFDLTASNHGNGLINMTRRTEALDGDVEFKSAPGKGTMIELKFSI